MRRDCGAGQPCKAGRSRHSHQAAYAVGSATRSSSAVRRLYVGLCDTAANVCPRRCATHSKCHISLLTAARFQRQLLTTEADSCDRLHSDMRIPIVTIRCPRPHCKINCGSQSNYRHTELGQKSLWLKRSVLSPVSTAFFGTVMTALLFNMLLTVVSHHPPKSH